MRAVSILLLVLWSCACSTSSPEASFQSAKSLLLEGKLDQALAAADAGYRAEPSWRFRILRAEILLQIDPQKAIEALDAAGTPPSADLRARVEMDRGWAADLASRYSAAEESLNRARQIAAPLDQPLLHAEIGINLGTVLAQEGKSDAADESLRAALQEATEQQDPRLHTRALGTLGWFLLFTHRPEESIYWFERQRDAAARMGWTRSLANALGNLGNAYYRLGDYDTALQFLNQAEGIFEKLGDRRAQQIWLGSIGNVLYDRKEFSKALAKYQAALSIARSLPGTYWTAEWLANLALTNIDLGDFASAEQYTNEALRLKQELKDNSDLFAQVDEARIALGRKDYPHAEKLFRAILATPSDDSASMLQAELGLSQLDVETGQLDRADAQFRSCIDRVERQRAGLRRDDNKLSYLSSLIEFYQHYVDFLVTRGEVAKAMEVAESSRARLLDERLRSDAKTQAVSASALQRLSRSAGATLLSFWLAPERSFLWAVTPDGIELHVLPPEKQIAALVESYRGFIENLRDPLEAEFPAGRELSEILLGPVRELLKPNARLIIVPDRSLHSLNLETLPDPDQPSRYLIERVTVEVAPSLGILTEARRTQPAQASILLIGDPEPAVEEYPRLPYAAQEMSLIEQKFDSRSAVVLQGSRANPAAYREAGPAQFSWIHFAAHATANRESPLDSALILARHDGGYALSARDVMNVPLNADLVTLSACRSAGARTYSGEGLVGLSWAFLRAGAKSVVAGLWDVTDLSTASLMSDFYAQLANHVPAAEALRQAKLRLVRSKGAYRKPFYWGPFQLYAGAAF